MSDFDRGAYTPPTDEPFAFDARAPQIRRQAPATLLGAVIVLVVLVGAVAFFYWSGQRGAGEGPKVVGKPALEIKTQPADSKASDLSDKLQVYDEEKGQTQPETSKPVFAPPPEEPQPRPAVTTVAQAPAPPPAKAAPAPVKTAPAPVAVASSAPPPPVVSSAKAQHAAAAPVVEKKAEPVRTQLAVNTPAKPAKPAAAKAAAAEEPATAPPPADAAHSVKVQFGAYDSQAKADAEYKKAKAEFAALTVGKSKSVERAVVGGKTYFRTAFTGFDRAGAKAFCKALIAAKKGCIVR